VPTFLANDSLLLRRFFFLGVERSDLVRFFFNGFGTARVTLKRLGLGWDIIRLPLEG
jgi:hypothetical protein